MFRQHSLSSIAVLSLYLAIHSSEAIAQVGPASYSSLESMVHNSEVVLVGRILDISGQREQLGQMTYKIRLEAEEVIKGEDRDHESFYLFAERQQIDTWINSRARLVLKSPLDVNMNSESAWVMVDFAEPSLPRLSLGEDGVLKQITTEQEVLNVLRTTSQKLPGVVQMRTFPMPTELSLVKQANLRIQDGLPFVFVSIDRPLEAWAKRVIYGDTEITLDTGIRALKHFKSESNIMWLREAVAAEASDSKREVLNKLLEEWTEPTSEH
jgi:hypothetical protein